MNRHTQNDSRPFRINKIAQICDASSYLEIGVAKGNTFRQIQIANKVGVDPVFNFDYKSVASDKIRFYKTTSDQFFARCVPQGTSFDIIYLDGLHTFEQTLRDFCASLAFSHARTVWVIDDTVPISMVAAQRDRKNFRRLKDILEDPRPHWMGDVYKVIFAIHDFFPQFSYATFDGHGQTVIWRQSRPSFLPLFNDLAGISGLGYEQFLMHMNLIMNIRDFDQVLVAVQEGYPRLPARLGESFGFLQKHQDGPEFHSLP